jgi:hypothetical protein
MVQRRFHAPECQSLTSCGVKCRDATALGDAPQAPNERRCRHKLVLGWPQIEQIVSPALVVTHKRCRCHCVDGPGARVGVETQENTWDVSPRRMKVNPPMTRRRVTREGIELAGGNSHQRLDMSQDG